MSRLFEPDDAVTQLTELMQHERVIEKTPIDPEVRGKRRRFRLVVGGTVVLLILAAAGSYAGITLNAPIQPAGVPYSFTISRRQWKRESPRVFASPRSRGNQRGTSRQ